MCTHPLISLLFDHTDSRLYSDMDPCYSFELMKTLKKKKKKILPVLHLHMRHYLQREQGREKDFFFFKKLITILPLFPHNRALHSAKLQEHFSSSPCHSRPWISASSCGRLRAEWNHNKGDRGSLMGCLASGHTVEGSDFVMLLNEFLTRRFYTEHFGHQYAASGVVSIWEKRSAGSVCAGNLFASAKRNQTETRLLKNGRQGVVTSEISQGCRGGKMIKMYYFIGQLWLGWLIITVSNISIILIIVARSSTTCWVKLQVVHHFLRRLRLEKGIVLFSKAREQQSSPTCATSGHLFNTADVCFHPLSLYLRCPKWGKQNVTSVFLLVDKCYAARPYSHWQPQIRLSILKNGGRLF